MNCKTFYTNKQRVQCTLKTVKIWLKTDNSLQPVNSSTFLQILLENECRQTASEHLDLYTAYMPGPSYMIFINQVLLQTENVCNTAVTMRNCQC